MVTFGKSVKDWGGFESHRCRGTWKEGKICKIVRIVWSPRFPQWTRRASERSRTNQTRPSAAGGEEARSVPISPARWSLIGPLPNAAPLGGYSLVRDVVDQCGSKPIWV